MKIRYQLVPVAVTLSLYAVGCRSTPPAPPAPPPSSATSGSPSGSGDHTAAKPVASTTLSKQIESAVDKTLKQSYPDVTVSPIPEGTKVLGVEVADDVATIDFSPEFNRLINAGDTAESLAQHELRRTLTPFAAINKMRVTVAGKPFQSQNTDWNTPFSVREADVDLSPQAKRAIDEGVKKPEPTH